MGQLASFQAIDPLLPDLENLPLSSASVPDIAHKIRSMVDEACFSSSQPAIKNHLNDFWEHSCEVAAYCYMLAKNSKLPHPEQAMLAGLVHQIGTLPLCLHAEQLVPNLDPGTLDGMMWDFRDSTSRRLLRAWNFPEEIIAAVTAQENPQQAGDSAQVSYADIIAVAKRLSHKAASLTVWERIKPAGKLGLSPETCTHFSEQFRDEFRATRERLLPC